MLNVYNWSIDDLWGSLSFQPRDTPSTGHILFFDFDFNDYGQKP